VRGNQVGEKVYVSEPEGSSPSSQNSILHPVLSQLNPVYILKFFL